MELTAADKSKVGQQHSVVCSLEFSLQIHYAKAIVKKFEKISRLLCFGCKNNYLSQRNHSCTMLDRGSKLNVHFWDIIGVMDEEAEI